MADSHSEEFRLSEEELRQDPEQVLDVVGKLGEGYLPLLLLLLLYNYYYYIINITW